MELPLAPIPESSQILEAFAGIKTLDKEGRVVWYFRYSPTLTCQEILGEVEVIKALNLKDILNAFIPDEEE